MESPNKQIEHPGIVEKVVGQRVFVRVETRSACGSCHAKSHCSMTDLEEKVVEVESERAEGYAIGDKVTVTLEPSLGFKALLLAYVYPFLILLVSILVIMAITGNELLSAMVGIGLMFPYYAWIYLIREKLRNHFHFRIKESW